MGSTVFVVDSNPDVRRMVEQLSPPPPTAIPSWGFRTAPLRSTRLASPVPH